MGKLVEAAVDAREMLLDYEDCKNGRFVSRLPQPPLKRSRLPSIPAPPTLTQTTVTPSTAAATMVPTTTIARKRKSDEFWDDPLPQPKIRNAPSIKQEKIVGKNDTDEVELDEWVGLAGVDIFEKSRARNVYSRGISSHQFLFPLCHDTYIYGKIRELQAARVNFAGILQETAVLEMIRTEGNLQHEEENKKRRKVTKKSEKKVKGGGEEEDDDEDDEEQAEEEELGGPSWPGDYLEYLLPLHKNIDAP
jgi:hypothetical protein